ncbi:MAG: hypothetical protein WAW91_03580 [Candidatus Nanoperiomorbaceae bacterium]
MNNDGAHEVDDWSQFDSVSSSVDNQRQPRTSSVTVDRPRGRLLFLIGFIAGAVVLPLAAGLDNWIMRPLFCRNIDTATVCAGRGAIAFYFVTALIGIIVALILWKSKTSRPLAIAFAVAVALAGLYPLLGSTFLIAMLVAAIFGALFSLFFYKITQLQSRPLVLIVILLSLLGIWLVAR